MTLNILPRVLSSLILALLAPGTCMAAAETAAVYPVIVDPLLTRETKLMAGDGIPDDGIGSSVAVSANTAVVGSYWANSAYVFVRNGGVWSQQAKLTARDTSALVQFGFSVAISGDTALIGAIGDDSLGFPSGSAYVFVRNGGVWSQQQKLTANDASSGDVFGFSVAISGDTAVVGDYRHSDAGLASGAAYVFARNGGGWSQQQKLTASDAAAGDVFGGSVAIEGDTVVVGSRFDGDAGYRSGSAYVFVRNGSIWSQQQKLVASDASEQDEFGYSVAISGDTAVIGAPSDSTPGFFDLVGSAYVFVRNGGLWSQQAKLIANERPAARQLGWSVAVNGDLVVAGAPFESAAAFHTGSAYLFLRSGGVWSQDQKLTASDAQLFNDFGWSAALSGTTAVIGSPFGQLGANPGSAYVYEPELTALSPAKVWVGLKNSDDTGIRFDLKANIYLSGILVGSGYLNSISGGSSGFNNASLSSIPLTLTAPATVSTGDALTIEFLVRNACAGSGKNSGTARLWYNGRAVDSGAVRDAGTRFDATIGGTDSSYFLRGNSVLSAVAGTSRLFVDRAVGSRCSAFVPVGTWSKTF